MWRKLLGSASIGGLVSAVVGYLAAHADPTAVTLVSTIVGAVGAIIGVVTHHANTTISK